MKKKLLLSVCILIFAFISAEAKNSITIRDISINNQEMTVGFDASGFSSEEWITLMTCRRDSAENPISVEQFKSSEDISVSFKIPELETGSYLVKMGGDGIDSPTVMGITVGDKPTGEIRFINTDTNLFIGKASSNQLLLDETRKLFRFDGNKKYIAASAVVPTLDGYTVKEYGIRLNGKDYQAKVELGSVGKFGVLFHGDEIIDGFSVNAFPYITYEKENEEDITYFGNSCFRTVGINDNIKEEIEDKEENKDIETENPDLENNEGNIVFSDDFTEYEKNTLPSAYRMFNSHAGTVKVAEYDVGSGTDNAYLKNCLEIDDNNPAYTGSDKYAGPGFNLTFPEVSERYACEVRMMFLEESNPYVSMSLCTTNNGSYITRLSTASATGITGTVSSVGDTAEIGELESGKWYTIRFVVDLESDSYQMKVSSKEAGIDALFGGLGFADENSSGFESVNGISFNLSVYDGKMVFDYIKIEKAPEFYEEPEDVFIHPVPERNAPLTTAPVNHKLENKINLCLNGEYLYPASPLFEKEEEVMIYIKNSAHLFGGSYENAKLFLNGKTFEFNENSRNVLINGAEKTLPVSCEKINGKLYVPLLFVISEAGYEGSYEKAEQTVYLKMEAK